MQYKIINLRVKNFKCFDNTRYYEFSLDSERNPVILSGPNGFGKTTFFDAIELMFSKNITRLDSEIENRNTNLGKNILLNTANEDGYVVLTLRKEENEILTLFAKILKDNHKLEVKDYIYYGEIKKFISTTELDNVFNNYNEWKNSVDNETLIKYRAKNFNVYYYVSQAESVHFLKRTITDRKNAMNVLLNMGFVDERIETITKLIGNRIGTNGYAVNDEITTLNNVLQQKAAKLKALIKGTIQSDFEKIEYVNLGLYKKNAILYFWDSSNITKLGIDEVKRGKNALDRIISFLENESDYRNYQWNTEIKKIIKGNSIKDYVETRAYIINNLVSVKKIEEQLEKWDSIIQIYNSTQLFRQELPDAISYKDEYVIILKNLVPELREYDFSLIKNISSEIIDLKKTLSTNQKIIDKLLNARNVLKNTKDEYNEEGTVCPFCNTRFQDVKSLNDGFEDVNKLLKSESGDIGKRIATKNIEFGNAIAPVKKIIHQYVNGLDDKAIRDILQRKISLNVFIGDVGRVSNVEKIIRCFAETEYIPDTKGENPSIEIQRVLSGLIKNIQNEDFDNLFRKYEYNNVETCYGDSLNDIKKNISLEVLKRKRKYLEKVIWEKENTEIYTIKREMKVLIVKKEKMENVRKQLNKLSNLYKKTIDDYKNITLKELRVPLLIYTGKILQDYQNGLGVFVNKKEMRFVSNGDAKHDILNTFSSGQLSGFVLAFLFAMNKQYIKESSDDIGFILIDDPVQTMDDINISSLIEVLRNDFSDKQIILSTHEMDKENYILYKFYKYNKKGLSFNVKEEMYV
ncbi:AAA family ATPase [Pectinatus frisingensis]|uniref:AAA family ATPase n=1 Tax=Pectinatus frisingensis TaxID=865 RepID=UPI003D807E2C